MLSRFPRDYLIGMIRLQPKDPQVDADIGWAKDTILAKGWTHCHGDKWARPGKECEDGISAQVHPWGMYVYSDGADLKYGWHKPKDIAKFYDVKIPASSKDGIRLIKVDTIIMKPVKWLWEGRIPLGALTLLGGREGIGKSTLAYTLAAEVSRGLLPGARFGNPQGVAVVATEDSWSHTIKPRLVAAGADLSRVFIAEAADGGLVSLPKHIDALAEQIQEEGIALLLLDPLMSRLDGKLDTHKDSEVRQALEPLTKMADETEVALAGLIHVNKSGSTDPLTMLMGSRAFAAVSRAVIFVAQDTERPEIRVVGSPKNNLGRSDLPDIAFTIVDTEVGEYEGEIISAGKLAWTESGTHSLRDVIEAARSTKRKGQIDTAETWLEDYLLDRTPDCVPSAEIKLAAVEAGYSESTIKRTAQKLKVVQKKNGFPAVSCWELGVDLWGDEID